jgi:hypothetical protein
MARSSNPATDIALMALQANPLGQTQMLEAVLTYAFEQLCWRKTETDIDLLIARLQAMESA